LNVRQNGVDCNRVIFLLINDGRFKQTLHMSLGKIPWPEEQPSCFPGRKKKLEYRPAPKQWALAPKQDENKRGE
jgi:hypothetical protein